MTNLGSLLHSPVTYEFDTTGESAAQLLELRTDTGAVYVRPSRWQRIRLRWIFRNFHVLPPQVLSRRDQRLIAKLAQFAVVTPVLPVTGRAVFGVIEKVRAQSAAAADQVFEFKKAGPRALPDEPEQVGEKTSWNLRLAQLGAVAALSAICVAVFLASALSSGSPPVTKSASASAVLRAPDAIKPAAPMTAVASLASSPLPSKAKRSIPPPLAAIAPQEPEPLSASGFAERRQVSELPPGHFAHPIVAQRNLDGEVQLRALIGIDGSVKEVTVVRGDPRLAEAGVRAVRQWHYRPHEELGRPMEVETLVAMKFFGQDAVSIASIANQSTSLLR